MSRGKYKTIYLVWFKKPSWEAWGCEEPTFYHEDAEDQIEQARSLGMEHRLQRFHAYEPDREARKERA